MKITKVNERWKHTAETRCHLETDGTRRQTSSFIDKVQMAFEVVGGAPLELPRAPIAASGPLMPRLVSLHYLRWNTQPYALHSGSHVFFQYGPDADDDIIQFFMEEIDFPLWLTQLAIDNRPN